MPEVVQNGSATLEKSWAVSYKHLLYDPKITLKGNKNLYIQKKKHYARIFIAMLFILSKNYKQSKYPSTDECINKLWYIHTVDSAQRWKGMNDVHQGWSSETLH